MSDFGGIGPGDFGALVNALSGGGDRGNIFPQSDSDELRQGARFIPGGVTDARRRGETVTFTQNCGPCCWYWEFPDGTRTYHYDPITFREIGVQNNGAEWAKSESTSSGFDGPAGPCPNCGNEHTHGGTVAPAAAPRQS